MPRDCPDCGRGLRKNAKSCQCGWGVVAADAKPSRDPDWWRCCHEILGQLCANAGTLSDSTHGSGSWYCHAHYPGFHGRPSGKTAPPGGFITLRRAIGQARQREPGEDE